MSVITSTNWGCRLPVALRQIRTGVHLRLYIAAEALPWVRRRHQLEDEVAVVLERLGETLEIVRRLDRAGSEN